VEQETLETKSKQSQATTIDFISKQSISTNKARTTR